MFDSKIIDKKSKGNYTGIRKDSYKPYNIYYMMKRSKI